MRVLVSGAGGFLGIATVTALAAAGHEVRGLVRQSGQFAAVRGAGGEPVLGDLLAPRTLEKHVAGCAAVIHLAQTSGTMTARRRVRVEGGRNLLRAAVAAGVRRGVIGSGYWVYRDNRGTVSEDSPLEPLSISKVNYETEALVRTRRSLGSIESVILRPGMVYGPGSWFSEMVDGLRDGSYEYIADGSNYLSPVHLADAGAAFRCALEAGAPGEVYLVADNAPATTREFADFVARRLRLPLPRSLPYARAKREWGADIAKLNRASRRVSNRKLRSLGWKPRYGTFRRGVPVVLEEMAA